MKININKKYIIIAVIILLIIIGLVVLNTTGVLKKIGKTKEQITQAEAQEKLEQALQSASTQKETDANYNSSEYLTSLLEEQNIIVIENIVAIDGYNFEIDRENLSIAQSLGKSQVTVNSELIEVLGKNDNGKYRAKVQVTVTSNIPIDNMIFQNENGTYLKETTEELTYTKEMEVELDKEYVVTIVTKDGKIENKKLKNIISEIEEIEGDSLLEIVEDSIDHSGYFLAKVNETSYNIHAYMYNSDMTLSEDTVFGNEYDVANASEYAKNMVVVKINGDLTIDEGVSVTAYKNDYYGGPKGLMLYVVGNITNNGTITMTARGAKAEGENVYLWKNADITNSEYELVPAVGASGGAQTKKTSSNNGVGNSGQDGTGRQTGGGGAGASNSSTWYSGAGGKGTSYSGGAGGGGAVKSTTGIDGSSVGGSGGSGGYNTSSTTAGTSTNRSGQGSGNPIGGTGGLLILYAKSIYNNSKITSDGVTYTNTTSSTNQYAGGGASGGGSINIFYKQNFTKGTIEANGKEGSYNSKASTNYRGGSSGAGTVSCGSIATGTYVEYTEE